MPRPNIVLIMTDQQRADFTKADGFPLDTMPFLDSLGVSGVRFRNAYTPMPVCAPARCSMLSGRFPKATGVRENGGIRNMRGPRDLADILRAEGYSINISGKNHSHLTARSFDFSSFYGHTGGGRPERKSPSEKAMDQWLAALKYGHCLTRTPFPLECQLPYRIVDDAMECLDRRDRKKPFFLWLSFPEPHEPYQTLEPYFSMFPEESVPPRIGPEAGEGKGEKWRWMRRLIEKSDPGYDAHWRRYRATYCGMMRLVDDQIRRFVGFLGQAGLSEETLIVFTSDHGDYAGDYGLQRKGVGLPECLVRVPLVFAGAGVRPSVAPGVMPSVRGHEAFVSLVDIMPTICESLGIEFPYGVQGRSLWPLLTGGEYPAEEFRSIYAELGFGGLHYGEHENPPLHFPGPAIVFDELNSVTQSGNVKMVRMGAWKLEYDMMGCGRLYNVEKDPGELENLWDDPGCKGVRAELTEELLRWTIRTEDDLPSGSYIPKRAERNWYSK